MDSEGRKATAAPPRPPPPPPPPPHLDTERERGGREERGVGGEDKARRKEGKQASSKVS